ncbi:serine O-acetyltransferase [Bradyrhizobium iriomotense]|uniref:serine O-acetyltransferase n=1 Tax=Bradyrhizobium iriomotense TaxID=441950 RepID=UPI001B8A2E21|nr:serine O-acetyltransferase [Bradyrhizobium iriomotense]MBR1133808.1 serine acetyltransferase [Bradyrhizobium iriomotense]
MSMWRQDLERNAARSGLTGALIAYVTSPGFALVSRARLASWLNVRGKGGRLLSRLVWRSTVRNYGCYVAPAARLGAGLCLPHPVGIVIGEGSVIGNDVTIYQGVTLGRASHDVDAYPSIDDGAVIYAGATLLGPIRIGRNAIVAAHSVVLSDVPDFATVVGAPARIVGTARAEDRLQAADVNRAAASR